MSAPLTLLADTSSTRLTLMWFLKSVPLCCPVKSKAVAVSPTTMYLWWVVNQSAAPANTWLTSTHLFALISARNVGSPSSRFFHVPFLPLSIIDIKYTTAWSSLSWMLRWFVPCYYEMVYGTPYGSFEDIFSRAVSYCSCEHILLPEEHKCWEVMLLYSKSNACVPLWSLYCHCGLRSTSLKHVLHQRGITIPSGLWDTVLSVMKAKITGWIYFEDVGLNNDFA